MGKGYFEREVSEEELRAILGRELSESPVVEAGMQEAYGKIRKMSRNKAGKGFQKGLTIFGTIAAAMVVAFTCCAVNPALAKRIPIVGGIFLKVQSYLPYGEIPQEDVTVLYDESDAAQGEEAPGAGAEALLEKKDNGLDVTLTEIYASNQAIFLGVSIKNDEDFPAMCGYADPESAPAFLELWTHEQYSFRSTPIESRRTVEGNFEDSRTFIGVMRIDYSDIDIDESRYEEMCAKAEASNQELPTVDADVWDQYFDRYEIPESFDMDLKVSRFVGYLENPTKPEGMVEKSEEELVQMSDEEFKAYIDSLPKELSEYPNQYENWVKDGQWEYALQVEKKTEDTKTIVLNEINEEGIGIESVEISPVEITLHDVFPAEHLTFAVALDKNGKKLPYGMGENVNELAIGDCDISTIYIYICDYDEYMDEIKGYAIDPDPSGKSFQQILEERALFKTVLDEEKLNGR